MFSCEFFEISKNTFFTEHFWTTASVLWLEPHTQVSSSEKSESGVAYVMFFTIWYHLCNLKTVKNAHGRVLLLLKWSQQTQDVNQTYIRRSEDVLDVFWTSYVRSIYVLCLLGQAFNLQKKDPLRPNFDKNWQNVTFWDVLAEQINWLISICWEHW